MSREASAPAHLRRSDSDATSESGRIRQEEIDRLRNRVDSVLQSLVQGSGSGAFMTTSAGELPVPPRKGSAGERSLPGLLAASGEASDAGGGESSSSPPAFLRDGDGDGGDKSARWIVDPYGDQGQFTGPLNEADLPDGRGTMLYTDGRVFTGDWKDGQWHGRGRATFTNGDVFEGHYHRDQRHGHGAYHWADGRVYEGDFCRDQRQGTGAYTWPDGAKYEGDFHRGLRHGEGRYTFKDGSVYVGEWHKGKYHGAGECQWADGRTYKGEWRNGKAHGYGIEIRPDGSVRHDGEWKDDAPVRTGP